jgi:predicted lipoprotein with Yx(FWY)xxD motif
MSAFTIGKLGLGAAGASALALLVAGCAASSSSGAPASAGSSVQQPAASAAAAGLKTMSTSIGTVLVDASGHTVYELVGDTSASQTCTAACAAIWPPVQANGAQVIVNGHPAFTFASDSSAGQTKGQNVTDQWGKWLALDANGNPISATASSAPAATTSAPGGSGPAF